MAEKGASSWCSCNVSILNGAQRDKGAIAVAGHNGELVERVRYLTDVLAAQDPEAATRSLDALIAQHGRVAVGAALLTVAPTEMAELARPRPGLRRG